MKKKLLAILLTLAMVVTMIPAVFVTVTAEAAPVQWTEVGNATELYTALKAMRNNSAGSCNLKLTKSFTITEAEWEAAQTNQALCDVWNVTLDGQGYTITITAGDGLPADIGQTDYPKFGILTARA
jgi:hypothetical protein